MRIRTNIYNCFTKNLFTDFGILVGTQKIAVHSVVLSAMSTVLNASMSQDFREKISKEIEIKDFKYETVNDAIEFIYSGFISDTKCDLELLRFADMYDIQIFVNFIEKRLIKKLKISNLYNYLEAANLLKAESLKIACLNFCVSEIKLGEKTNLVEISKRQRC